MTVLVIGHVRGKGAMCDSCFRLALRRPDAVALEISVRIVLLVLEAALIIPVIFHENRLLRRLEAAFRTRPVASADLRRHPRRRFASQQQIRLYRALGPYGALL